MEETTGKQAPKPKLRGRPRKTNSHCFVPECKTGYRSEKKKNEGQKISLFDVPKDMDRRKKWENAIPRQDLPLTDTSAICELHFDERFIIRNWTHTINGKQVEIPRERPILSTEALPTIFPNLPERFNKFLPKQRNPKKRTASDTSGQNIIKKIKASQYSDVSDLEVHKTISESSTVVDCCPSFRPLNDINDLSDVRIPSQFWTLIQFQGKDHVCAFCKCSLNLSNEVYPERQVILTQKLCKVACKVIIRNVVHESIDNLQSKELLESKLHQIDKIVMCSGAGTMQEFPGISSKYMHVNEAVIYHNSCQGACLSDRSKNCVPCKYLRKTLLSQRARFGKSNNGGSHATLIKKTSKVKTKGKQVQRLKRKINVLSRTVAASKEATAQTEEESLQAKIKDLPPKQKICIMQCFKAAGRMSTKGMRYDNEWILECIVMCMKSPRLYDHIQKNKLSQVQAVLKSI